MGSRATAMGYASSCLSDEWSVFNNIAGIAKVNSMTGAFTYDTQPTFKPFNKAAAVFVFPIKFGVTGIGLYRFGDDLYNEQVLTTGFGNTFGIASLGVKINYIQYNAEGFGRKDALSVSFGGIAELTPSLLVGAHIVNINQPRVSSQDDERIPTILSAGISIKLSDKAMLAIEVEKDLDYKPTIKSGLEYQAHKKFCVRTGFNLQPGGGFFGFGFKPGKFTIDCSYHYRQEIGNRSQATVGYTFRRKEQK